MLLSRDTSTLLLIDVQEKLLSFIHEREQLISNCRWLIEAANALKIPLHVSEQYPKGLGRTDSALRALFDESIVKSKVHFSCVDDEGCLKVIAQTKRNQIVLIGIEAHVCVLQTALGLVEKGYDVFVVADAISSRAPNDIQLALKRMQHSGVQIVSKEMVFFEWLHQAGTELFKKMSKQFF